MDPGVESPLELQARVPKMASHLCKLGATDMDAFVLRRPMD
jgi:hypothetical protein